MVVYALQMQEILVVITFFAMGQTVNTSGKIRKGSVSLNLEAVAPLSSPVMI